MLHQNTVYGSQTRAWGIKSNLKLIQIPDRMNDILGGSATPEDEAGKNALEKRLKDGDENVANYNKKVAARGTPPTTEDSPGILGPDFSFSDELPTPHEIGVYQGGSVDAIVGAMQGVNYYTDAIGFGSKTGFNPRDLSPMGIRYFMKTGAICSNGAAMHEYLNSTPRGDLLGKRVSDALAQEGLPQMRGLAPGILEDARDALNPFPIFRAAMGNPYPKCRLVRYPVGDNRGRIQSDDGLSKWVSGDFEHSEGQYYQSRWIQDRTGKNGEYWDGRLDSTGNIPSKTKVVTMVKVDYDNDPKLFYPDGQRIEGFSGHDEYIDTTTLAGIMFAALTIALFTFALNK